MWLSRVVGEVSLRKPADDQLALYESSKTTVSFEYSQLSNPFSGIEQFLTSEGFERGAFVKVRSSVNKLVDSFTDEVSASTKSLLTQFVYQEVLKASGMPVEQLTALLQTGVTDVVATVLTEDDVEALQESIDSFEGELEGLSEALSEIINSVRLDLSHSDAVMDWNFDNEEFGSSVEQLFSNVLSLRAIKGRALLPSDSISGELLWLDGDEPVVLDHFSRYVRSKPAYHDNDFFIDLQFQDASSEVNQQLVSNDPAVMPALNVLQQPELIGQDKNVTKAWLETAIQVISDAQESDIESLSKAAGVFLNEISPEGIGWIEDFLLK